MRQLFSEIAIPTPDAVYLETDDGDTNINYGTNPAFGPKLALFDDDPLITLNGTTPKHGGAGRMRETNQAQVFSGTHPISDQSFTILAYNAFPRYPTSGGNPMCGVIGTTSRSLYLEMSATGAPVLRARHGDGASVSIFAEFRNISKFMSLTGRNLMVAAIGRDVARGVTFAFCNGQYKEGPADTNDYNFAAGVLHLSWPGNRAISVQQQVWLQALSEAELNTVCNNRYGTWIE